MDQLTLFAADTHASRSQPRGAGEAKRTRGTSGRKCSASYESASRGMSFVKTLEAILASVSTPLPHNWKTTASPSGRLLFQLAPSVPRTGGTGFGLWPTPVAQDDNKSPEAHLAMKARMKGGHRTQITSLNVMVKAIERGLWQTPVADDALDRKEGKWNSRGEPKLSAQVKLWPTTHGNCRPRTGTEVRESGQDRQTAAKHWPTPAARDYRSPNKLSYAERGGGKKGEQLPNAVGGQLNPAWVELLMGFPLGWTEIGKPESPASLPGFPIASPD